MTIQLEVYLPFRGKSMWRGEESVPAGTTVSTLLAELGIGEPELTVLVGGRYAPADRVLESGNKVTVLRQIEGG